jgi:hypothetical protein
MAKRLITLGIILVTLGLTGPPLAKPGPGGTARRMRLARNGFAFYFPVTTSLVVSVPATLVLLIFRRWRNRDEGNDTRRQSTRRASRT